MGQQLKHNKAASTQSIVGTAQEPRVYPHSGKKEGKTASSSSSQPKLFPPEQPSPTATQMLRYHHHEPVTPPQIQRIY